MDNTTKRWRVHFTGRRIGALGISYPIVLNVIAVDEKAAVLACYETHEHIHGHRVTLATSQTGPRCESAWHTNPRAMAASPDYCQNCGENPPAK